MYNNAFATERESLCAEVLKDIKFILNSQSLDDIRVHATSDTDFIIHCPKWANLDNLSSDDLWTPMGLSIRSTKRDEDDCLLSSIFDLTDFFEKKEDQFESYCLENISNFIDVATDIK